MEINSVLYTALVLLATLKLSYDLHISYDFTSIPFYVSDAEIEIYSSYDKKSEIYFI